MESKDYPFKNYAFVDSSNLYLGVKDLGWELDFKKFRDFLEKKYRVEKAYLFIGNVPRFKNLYQSLQEKGYILMLKPTIPDDKGKPKGNIDADLVLQAILEFKNYEKAIIVSGDGDFYSLTHHLYANDKLLRVIAPNNKQSSCLLREEAKEKIIFLDDFKEKLEYIEET